MKALENGNQNGGSSGVSDKSAATHVGFIVGLRSAWHGMASKRHKDLNEEPVVNLLPPLSSSTLMLPSILIVLSLFAPLSLAVVQPVRRDPLHIPISRRNHPRRDGEADVDHYATVAAKMRHKYKFGSLRESRRSQTSDIGITNEVRHGTVDYPMRGKFT